MKTLCAWMMAALLASTSMVASAGLVTVRFAGSIEQVFSSAGNPFASQIGLGAVFSGTYTFDTSTPNTGTSDYGVYIAANPLIGFTLEIEGITGTSLGSTQPLNYRVVGPAAASAYIQDIQTTGLTFGGESAFLTQIFLKDPSATALTGVELVADAPVLGDYVDKTLWLGIGPIDPLPDQVKVVYIGRLSELELQQTQTVSEPATVLLLALAVLALAVLRGVSSHRLHRRTA